MNGRRILFWVLAVLFAALVVAWVLYVPYRPEALYRALPVQATFVTAHAGLADRWQDVAENPLFQSLALSVGADREELADFSRSPDSDRILQQLAFRETLFAFIPQLGPRREDAWVFVSWLGGRSQRLRWMLSFRSLPGLEAVGRQRGRTIWAIKAEGMSGRQQLRAVLVEGMVIGCLSGDPGAMQDVLDVYDGFAPSLGDLPYTLDARMDLRDADAPDRGWVRLGSGWEQGPLRWALTRFQPRDVLGRAEVKPSVPLPRIQGTGRDLTALETLLGEYPQAVCLVDVDLLKADTITGLLPGAIWPVVVSAALSELSPGPVALALMSGDFSGRFKGLKLPSLLLALPLDQPDQAEKLIQGALDRLNAAYRWGLISSPMEDGRLVTFEATGDTPYASFKPDERMAYAVSDKHLLLCSNAGALSRVLPYTTRPPANIPQWVPAASSGDPAVSLWIDLASSGKTLRSAVAVYSLKLLLEDPEKTQGVREALLLTQAWVEALEPFGQAWVTGDSSGQECRFDLRLGPADQIRPMPSGRPGPDIDASLR